MGSFSPGVLVISSMSLILTEPFPDALIKISSSLLRLIISLPTILSPDNSTRLSNMFKILVPLTVTRMSVSISTVLPEFCTYASVSPPVEDKFIVKLVPLGTSVTVKTPLIALILGSIGTDVTSCIVIVSPTENP